DVNECSEKNGGCVHICSNFAGGFNCSCNDGFQLMNDKKGCKPCLSGTWGKDCQRDCNCRDFNTDCNETTGCEECPEGFKGGDCHDDIDECSSDPCDKHAHCNNTIGTFKCICAAGFTQFNTTVCQDLDECESDPCANGGDCENRDNAFSCTCLAGYTGTNCETDIDECKHSICKNNGTCKDLVNDYRCNCVRGFTGRNCETEIEICDSSPCMNGGTCRQDFGKYECHCAPGYTGLNCETVEVVPASDIKKVNIQLSLTSEAYSTSLEDRKSDEYKLLKRKVITALATILDKKLKGQYEIVDVTFSAGSVVVKYVLEMMKDTKVESETVVSDEIRHNGGNFAGFKVDPDSVKAQEIMSCNSSPCMNGGTCRQYVDKYECHCPRGYSEFNCERVARHNVAQRRHSEAQPNFDIRCHLSIALQRNYNEATTWLAHGHNVAQRGTLLKFANVFPQQVGIRNGAQRRGQNVTL
ncbi:hypothetical protein NP493_1364g00006, partial [Ridgeia piscesae]